MSTPVLSQQISSPVIFLPGLFHLHELQKAISDHAHDIEVEALRLTDFNRTFDLLRHVRALLSESDSPIVLDKHVILDLTHQESMQEILTKVLPTYPLPHPHLNHLIAPFRFIWWG